MFVYRFTMAKVIGVFCVLKNLNEREEMFKMEEKKNTLVEFQQQNVLEQYYKLLFPDTLREKEYVRLIAIRRSRDGTVERTHIQFVKSYEEYERFILKYRCAYDVYNQLATNRGNEKGNKGSQRQRKVLYLDFDKKDYPDLTCVQDFSGMIKEKFPKLFLHAIIDSGHGYHFYVSIPGTSKLNEVVELNKQIVEITGADLQAVSPTQISRPPCTYNHKVNGQYDYAAKDKWSYVKTILNCYRSGLQFRELSIPYLHKLVDQYYQAERNKTLLKRTQWNYTELNEYPSYLCIRKIQNEGADRGERNFWHGRIVKLLQMEGYTEEKIYTLCQCYNENCRPPKSRKEIENDTRRFMQGNYKFLGCYESISDKKRQEWVKRECDKINCGTYHNGAKAAVSVGPTARLNNKLLSKEMIQTLTGNELLILTMIEMNKNSHGRTGFRVKHLKQLLWNTKTEHRCISERKLSQLLKQLEQKKIIILTADKNKPCILDERKIKFQRRYNEFQKGYVEYYFNIAKAVMAGRLSQNDYRVYLALVKRLQAKEGVSYEMLAEYTGISPTHIGRHIRKLAKEECLIMQKVYTEKGYECNKYTLINPEISDGSPLTEYEEIAN